MNKEDSPVCHALVCAYHMSYQCLINVLYSLFTRRKREGGTERGKKSSEEEEKEERKKRENNRNYKKIPWESAASHFPLGL